MSLGSNFLKPAIAPLNFANVSLMGRLITSGLRELSAANLMKQLRAGVAAAAAGAGVRSVDVEKLLPMARFEELARKIDAHQKHAVGAWDDRPVDFDRTGDLAHLTEQQNLPVLGDSLMRLATMANANPGLRMALYEMSHIVREWQQLVLDSGNKLEDPRALDGAVRARMLRRAGVVVAALGVLSLGGFKWQTVNDARTRVGARIGDGNPCAVSQIDPADLAHALPEQQTSIAGRKAECAAIEEKRAKEQAEREKKEAYAKECDALADAVTHGKAPVAVGGVPTKLVDFAKRVATTSLERSDLGPDEPAFPCADTDGLPKLQQAFENAVFRSNLWLTHVDMSERATAAVVKHKAEVKAETLEELDNRAEKLAVDALMDQRPVTVRSARHQCALKTTFGLKHRAFCAALLK